MALSPKQIAELTKLYSGGENVNAIADAYGVTAATVRYQLKKAGIYRPEGETEAESVTETDEDLGIGQDEPAQSVDLAALLNNPALAALIDQAVNARVAQLAVSPTSAPVASGDTTAVVKAIEHLLEVQSQQMPGYMKPLAADEVDRRAAALIEMRAMLRDYQTRGDAPHYVVGPQGLFDSTNVIRYEAGQEIRTYIEPVEDFVPMNESARRVHQAFIRSIGGSTPEIGAQIAEAMLVAKGKDVPLVGAAPTAMNANRVELVATTKRHDVAPPRVMGTSVPETHGVSMPVQPGVTQQPAGPSFVG